MTLSSTLLRTLPEIPTVTPAQALLPRDHTEPRVGEDGLEAGYVRKGRGGLQLCTEGLRFESSDDAEDMILEMGTQGREQGEAKERHLEEERSATGGGREFPPPISCIGKSGRPCVCFERHREDGRFVLRETWVPMQEVLRASREGGRLRLSFVQVDDEDFEENDRDETEDDRGDEGGINGEKSNEEEQRVSEEQGRETNLD